MQEENSLSEEDQALVDKFVSTGINSVERNPFHPFRLLFILAAIVTGFSLFSLYLARSYGVY